MVAEKWFGFHRGERLTVHIADGVRFISECVSAKKHGKSIVDSKFRFIPCRVNYAVNSAIN